MKLIYTVEGGQACCTMKRESEEEILLLEMANAALNLIQVQHESLAAELGAGAAVAYREIITGSLASPDSPTWNIFRLPEADGGERVQ